MRRAVLTAVIITLALGLALSPVKAEPASQDNMPVTLRVAMPNPINLDPGQLSRFHPNTRDLVENLYVGLTRFDPATNSIEPMLATGWDVSDDGLTWTIELRDDVYWTHYEVENDAFEAVRQVVAGDVVYAIQRACDPLRPSPVTPNLMAIKGCHTVSNAFPEVVNDLFIAREIGVRAIAPHTLEIELLFPASYFPTLLSLPELRPLPRESLSQTQTLTRAQMILTSGPYALKSWTADGMTLVRNPRWPDAYNGNIDAVDVTFSDNPTVEQVDIVRLASDQIAAAQISGAELLVNENEPGIMIGYSLDRAVVSVPEARRALSLALDRDALAASVFADGSIIAANQFTLRDVIAAPEADYALHDPAAARSAFAAAGFEGCNNIPEPLLLLVPNDDPVWTDLGNAIVQQWTETLGCNAALFEVRPIARTLLIELAHANYDPEQVTRSHMWLFTWYADYPDAHAWVNDALHCRYGYVRIGRTCSAADDLLDTASIEYDVSTRSATYSDVEQLFFGAEGSYPVAPLFHSSAAWLAQPWLSDVNTTNSARYDLWTIDTAAQPQ